LTPQSNKSQAVRSTPAALASGRQDRWSRRGVGKMARRTDRRRWFMFGWRQWRSIYYLFGLYRT